MSIQTTPVELTPTAGFCIKTTTLEPGYLPPLISQDQGSTQALSPLISEVSSEPGSLTTPKETPKTSGPSHGGVLEPTVSSRDPTPVPIGMKVFVNIAYDPNVPPPPDGSEEAVQKAMNGEVSSESGDGWYVPVIVSHPRIDKDKAGKPSLVVDCVYNSIVKNRALIDQGFKIFLVELALQRIESQTGLTLSRRIAKPNILSKGKLLPRTVRIPTALIPSPGSAPPTIPIPQPNANSTPAPDGYPDPYLPQPRPALPTSGPDGIAYHPSALKQLVKEEKKEKKSPLPRVEDEAKRALIERPDGTLLTSISEDDPNAYKPVKKKEEVEPLDYSWAWQKLDSGKLQVRIKIPYLPTSAIRSGQTALDIEPRRIILTVTPTQTIDLDRTNADAQIVSDIHASAREKASRVGKRIRRERRMAGGGVPLDKGEKAKLDKEVEAAKEKVMDESDEEVSRMLLLKRERPFEVDEAKARWNVADRELVITC